MSFVTKKINSIFTGCNSYGYGCLHHGLNRFRLINSGRISTFRCHPPVSKCSEIVGTKQLRINSTQRPLINSHVKFRTDCSIQLSRPITEGYDDEMGIEKDIKRYKPVPGLQKRMSEMHYEIAIILNELKSIVANGVRYKGTISGIAEKLNSLELDLHVADLIRLLYYMAVLKSGNEALLMKLTKEISNKFDQIFKPTPLIGSFSKSIRKLLIRDTKTLDKLLLWYSSNEMSLSATSEIIHTLAVLNYFPLQAEVLLKKSNNGSISYYKNVVQYLNFIWSLVLIDRAEENMIHDILDHSFFQKLEYSMPLGARNSTVLKLHNIYAYSKLRNFKINSDLRWIESGSSSISNLKRKKETDPDVKCFRDLIVHFLPLHTYSLSVPTESGFIIDALCYFTSGGEPMKHIHNMEDSNSIKLAISILSYQDYCFPDKTVTNGIVEFHRNYLESTGYKVLFLKYTSLQRESSLESKSKFLYECIQKVIPNFTMSKFSTAL